MSVDDANTVTHTQSTDWSYTSLGTVDTNGLYTFSRKFESFSNTVAYFTYDSINGVVAGMVDVDGNISNNTPVSHIVQ